MAQPFAIYFTVVLPHDIEQQGMIITEETEIQNKRF